jgi:ABC-type transport system involved in cytochrome c biogenesis ATPase subunit
LRILSLEITGLFGMFDYRVPLNREDRITILHGPNGFGKTAILRMVNNLFMGRYGEMRRIPFNTFQVELDSGESLSVTRILKQEVDKHAPLLIRLMKEGKEEGRSEAAPMTVENLPYPVEYIQQWIPGLARISAQMWRYHPTGEELTLEELLEQFGPFIPAPQPTPVPVEAEWLRTFRKRVKVRFIESQRLLRMGTQFRGPQYGQPGTSMEPSVAFYSQQLAQAIQAKLAEYAALSQTLDRSFPVRLVDQIQSPRINGEGATVDDLRKKLDELEGKRARLRAAGLLDQKDDFGGFQVPEQLQETTQQVLPVYVRDVEQKLSVFDAIAEKIDLLKGIINSRFFAKTMSISKERGFLFTTKIGQPLPPTLLSTGEQHMLVLLSELLFSIQPNSMVLIDEPEISLHVAWQQSFLSDLKRIADLSTIDILIATHSPQIIHDRWDLTVELENASAQEQPV